MEQLPKVRADIQFVPALLQGRQVIAVQDLLGLNEEVVVLAPEVVALLPFFDGSHSPRDLQEVLMRQRGGQLVMMTEVEKIVSDLDRLRLLQTEGYLERRREVRQEFARLGERPASHAGTAYPKDAAALKRLLDEILSDAGEAKTKASRLRVLVAPHIDLKAGRETYGKAYAALPGSRPARILLLGTGHTIEEGLFALTRKDFVTPLGRSPTDVGAVEALARAGGNLIAPDDFAHRREHALEFQLIFLQHLLPEGIPVVPVLFGTFDPFLQKVDSASQIPGVAPFFQTLAGLANDSTLVVAGVDLSHVGPKFGHAQPASFYQDDFRAHDEKLLDALCRGSAAGFWAEGKRVEDRFHVCGFPVLSSLLEALPGLSGQVLDYRIWHEAATRSAVSFAAVALS